MTTAANLENDYVIVTSVITLPEAADFMTGNEDVGKVYLD